MSPLIISIAAFFGVAAIVGAVAMLLRGGEQTRAEDRLAVLTAAKTSGGGKNMLQESGVLAQPLDGTQGALAEFLSRFRNLSLLFEQADTSLTPAKFFGISAGMGLAGSVAGAAAGINAAIIPAVHDSGRRAAADVVGDCDAEGVCESSPSNCPMRWN